MLGTQKRSHGVQSELTSWWSPLESSQTRTRLLLTWRSGSISVLDFLIGISVYFFIHLVSLHDDRLDWPWLFCMIRVVQRRSSYLHPARMLPCSLLVWTRRNTSPSLTLFQMLVAQLTALLLWPRYYSNSFNLYGYLKKYNVFRFHFQLDSVCFLCFHFV